MLFFVCKPSHCLSPALPIRIAVITVGMFVTVCKASVPSRELTCRLSCHYSGPLASIVCPLPAHRGAGSTAWARCQPRPQALWPSAPLHHELARCLGCDFCERFLNLQLTDSSLLGNHYSETWGREDLCARRLLPAHVHWLPGRNQNSCIEHTRALGRWDVGCWRWRWQRLGTEA